MGLPHLGAGANNEKRERKAKYQEIVSDRETEMTDADFSEIVIGQTKEESGTQIPWGNALGYPVQGRFTI